MTKRPKRPRRSIPPLPNALRHGPLGFVLILAATLLVGAPFHLNFDLEAPADWQIAHLNPDAPFRETDVNEDA